MRLTESDKAKLISENSKKENCSYDDESLRYAKLGQLEDIEEELGIDLITLFKALKNGVWEIDDYTNKLHKTDIRGIELYGLCGISMPNIPECDYTLHYEDYGKTWALTKEELE